MTTNKWLLLGQVPNAAEIRDGLLLLAGVLVALRPHRVTTVTSLLFTRHFRLTN